MVFPTVHGAELRDQIEILTTEGSVEARKEAARLMGGAPPSEDTIVIPVLSEVLLKPGDLGVRVEVAAGLGNIASANDEEEYRQSGGKQNLNAMRGEAIEALVAATGDTNWEVVEAATEQLGHIWPSNESAVAALVSVTNRNWEYSNPSLMAAKSLASIAGRARRAGKTEWIRTLSQARDQMTDPYDGRWKEIVSDEVVALENARDLGRRQSLKEVGQALLIGLAALHALVYLGLILGARRSEVCFRLIFDPFWGKASVYFHLLLRHAWLAQRWLFERYFRQVRTQKNVERRYHSMMLSEAAASELALSSSDLLMHWKASPRIWIQGRAGMGKTSLVNEVQRQYYSDPDLDCLAAATKRYGFMPIVVQASSLRGLETTSDPVDWLLTVVQQTLAHWRMPIEDRRVLRSLFSGGRFGLVIDGANEVERDNEITAFLMTMPNVPVLATSQRPPPSVAAGLYRVLKLPPDVGEHVQGMLELYLGPQRGREIVSASRASGLMRELKSGYDVGLIVDLTNRGFVANELPRSRMGLYEEILRAITGNDGSPYHSEALEELAWRLMLKGVRRFQGNDLGRDYIDPLMDGGQRVLRIVGDDEYEFRHDQMRAYLAARHLCNAPASTTVLIAELQDSSIWIRHKSDQTELWSFLADMIGGAQEAEILWRFSAQDERRVVLQHALQGVASTRSWPLALT